MSQIPVHRYYNSVLSLVFVFETRADFRRWSAKIAVGGTPQEIPFIYVFGLF